MNTISEDLDLFDSERGRRIPVRVWPSRGAPQGWILFSVGYGGDRSGYAYLARSWSGQDFAVAVVEHIGSNLEVLKSFPQKTHQDRNAEVVRRVQDPAELAARRHDLLFVRSHLAPRYPGLPVGVGGHSFGTFTALGALGLPTIPVLPPLSEPWTDPASCLLISPQPPGMLFPRRAYDRVVCPTLVLTGTKDALLNGEQDHSSRSEVYGCLPEDSANLVVLEGVEHMAFAGIGLGLAHTLDAIARLTTVWWQQTLLVNSQAQARAEAMRVVGGPGEYR